jgi:FecR protein
MNPERRILLSRLATAGALAAAAPFLIRNALAMGNRIATQGFHKVEGSVLLNGKPAAQGLAVRPGDKVSTGDNSVAIFVLDQDAYMLRSNSQLEISGADATIKTLTLIAGKMLSVFGKGEKRIVVPTATLGIRGTAIYAEADPLRAYLCTCYGTVNIQASSNPLVQETVVTKHHEAPRYIYASGEQLIAKAPMINHTDDELFMLEALVGRMPGFFSPTYDRNSSY